MVNLNIVMVRKTDQEKQKNRCLPGAIIGGTYTFTDLLWSFFRTGIMLATCSVMGELWYLGPIVYLVCFKLYEYVVMHCIMGYGLLSPLDCIIRMDSPNKACNIIGGLELERIKDTKAFQEHLLSKSRFNMRFTSVLTKVMGLDYYRQMTEEQVQVVKDRIF
jgi:hypothetical protein